MGNQGKGVASRRPGALAVQLQRWGSKGEAEVSRAALGASRVRVVQALLKTGAERIMIPSPVRVPMAPHMGCGLPSAALPALPGLPCLPCLATKQAESPHGLTWA